MAIVVGVFENYAAAQASVRDLIEHDFSSEAISVVGRHDDGEASPPAEVDTSGTAIGVGTGAVLGGALAAMGLAVPGIGWLLAAGPIAAALAGASIGAAAGGVIGVLVDVGIPAVEAERYAQAVKEGGTLVTVTVDDARADRALELLQRHHPVNVGERDGATTSGRMESSRPAGDPARETRRLLTRDVRRFPAAADDADDAAAYAFGRELALARPEAGVEWSVMEPEARRRWQERRPGTWDRCREAIQYGWEQSRRRPAA